jgi:hypothetical protein
MKVGVSKLERMMCVSLRLTVLHFASKKQISPELIYYYPFTHESLRSPYRVFKAFEMTFIRYEQEEIE